VSYVRTKKLLTLVTTGGLCMAMAQSLVAKSLDAVVQELKDRADIENIIAGTTFAADRMDGEGFAKYFAPDGEVVTVASKMHPEAGQTYKGPERLSFFVTKNQRAGSEFGPAASTPTGAGAPPAAEGTPSGNASNAPPAGGPPGGMAAMMAAGGNGVMHHIETNSYIKILDSSHAKHWGYWNLNVGGFAGVYDDDFIKINGKWFLNIRRIHYGSLNPEAG
jgi:hypothetical protein